MAKTTTLAVKVPIDMADGFRAVCEHLGSSVSEELREFIWAVANDKRFMVCDTADELEAYIYWLPGRGEAGV